MSSCEEKMSFDTEKEARDAAIVAKHQHGGKLAVYQCRNCGLWHLSSKYEEND